MQGEAEDLAASIGGLYTWREREDSPQFETPLGKTSSDGEISRDSLA